MNFDVTSDVVNDLWPLSRTGEASADSKRLVDQFLAENPDFAKILKRSVELPGAMPPLTLSPDAERRMLDDAQKRARLKLMIIGGSVALFGFLVIAAMVGAMFVVFRGFGS